MANTNTFCNCTNSIGVQLNNLCTFLIFKQSLTFEFYNKCTEMHAYQTHKRTYIYIYFHYYLFLSSKCYLFCIFSILLKPKSKTIT